MEERKTHILTKEELHNIRNQLFTQGKIYAIKCCREITGWGLKEAKEAIERYCYDLRKEDPSVGLPFDFNYGIAPATCALLIMPSDAMLQSVTLNLGDFKIEMDAGKHIDFISKDGNFRFEAEQLRQVLKFWDATRIA